MLTVTDDGNAMDTDEVSITVSPPANTPPTATITQPLDGAVFTFGETINYAGEGTDFEDGVLPAQAYSWEAAFVGGPFQPLATGVKSGSVTATLEGNFVIRLTVEDSDGLTNTDEVRISVLP